MMEEIQATSLETLFEEQKQPHDVKEAGPWGHWLLRVSS